MHIIIEVRSVTHSTYTCKHYQTHFSMHSQTQCQFILLHCFPFRACCICSLQLNSTLLCLGSCSKWGLWRSVGSPLWRIWNSTYLLYPQWVYLYVGLALRGAYIIMVCISTYWACIYLPILCIWYVSLHIEPACSHSIMSSQCMNVCILLYL